MDFLNINGNPIFKFNRMITINKILQTMQPSAPIGVPKLRFPVVGYYHFNPLPNNSRAAKGGLFLIGL